MRVLIVFGTRPEAIKMAPVIKAFEAANGIDLKVCVTAQHRTMLDQVLDIFGIAPDVDLGIMKPGQSLFDITADVLRRLGGVFKELSPDWVLVHGDTTTTMAATLAAFYFKIPVGHVEAGLRTGDIYSPWPEEMNRKVVDVMAELLFAPTSGARDALLREGACGERIHITGNTVIDALMEVVGRIEADPKLDGALSRHFRFLDNNKKLVLVTGHRRESFGPGLERICRGLLRIAEREDVELVYPVHLNENVQGPVRRWLCERSNIHLIDPLQYLPFVYLLNRSEIVITDSGGIQEEAPSLGKPVLVTRDVTERPEALQAGTALLVGTDTDRIAGEACRLLSDRDAYADMSRAHNPYGDGRASQRIVETVCNA